MAIRVTCPGCQTGITLPDTQAGNEAHCPRCQTAFPAVPSGEPPSSTEAAPAGVAPAEPSGPARQERPVRSVESEPAASSAGPSVALIVVGVAVLAVLFVLCAGGGLMLFFLASWTGYVAQSPATPAVCGVQYKLESGPAGMTLSPEGRLTWNVPANFTDPDAAVILCIRDAAGREVFHSFRLAVRP